MSILTADAILYYADNPVDFVEDVIRAKPDVNQREILNSVARYPLTSVRSGHGIGKSAVESWLAIWFLSTRPYPKIPCTAPTQHQLWDILWAEIAKWLRRNPALSKQLIWTKEKVYMKGHEEEWFAVGRTASKPDALQGFHADHVLYIIDEASGVKDEIFEPILGALSTEGSKLVMCGNPTKLTGFFYNSHHKNREQFNAMHIDGRNSSRVDQAFVDTIIDMFGEDSDAFRVRVAGDFPTQGDDVYIPLSLCEQSVATEYKPKEKPELIHIGADIARFGDDKTCIGVKIDEKAMFYKKINGQDTVRTAHDIALCGEQLVEKYKWTEEIPIKIDDGGVGGGVTDRLREMKRNDPKRFWWMNIIPVQFGATIRHKYFYDTTSYMMSVVKKLLTPQVDEDGTKHPIRLILPDDADLIAQLSSREYEVTENSKIKIESKKDIKRKGQHSPDEADCLLLMCLPVKPKGKKKGDETA